MADTVTRCVIRHPHIYPLFEKCEFYRPQALNRPLTQTFPGSAQVQMTYDLGFSGRLSAIQETDSNRSFTYNNRGQLTSETRTLGTETVSIGYVYNNATGQPSAMTYPSGKVLSYTWNANGEITALSLDGQPIVTGIDYLPFGPVKSMNTGAINQTLSYDQRYQTRRIQAGVLDMGYTRNLAGNVTSITGILTPSISQGDEILTYGQGNTLLTQRENGITRTYTYDANGNVVSDGIYTYTWDALNRLVQVEQNSTTIATYAYDTQNRRIRKTAGSLTIHYHYNAASQLIAETLTDGTVLREYFYLFGQPIAMQDYNTRPGLYYYVTDHLGTPQQIITATDTIVWQAAYLPFGKAQIRINLVENNLRFPGQYYDSETGLHYNWNRYYDPATGRYISADPIGLEGGMNLYLYVNGNPGNFVDPFGLWTLGLDFSGTAGAGAGVTGGYTLTIDSSGNVAIIEHWGGGGFGGVAAGVALQGQFTTAADVDALCGTGVSVGGSLGPGVQFTGEWLVGDGYQGLNLGGGAGPGLFVELHAMLEHSEIVYKINLPDRYNDVFGGYGGNGIPPPLFFNGFNCGPAEIVRPPGIGFGGGGMHPLAIW